MARTTLELRKRRHARIRRRLSGTAERPRVAVSRTNKHISAQIIDDVDRSHAGRRLVGRGRSQEDQRRQHRRAPRPSPNLLAQRAKEANITAVVFDRGGFDYHGRVAAFADTLRAAGLEF